MGVLGASWVHFWVSWGGLGGSWELLGRSWGGLGRSWGDLAVTFRAVQFSIDFLIDFGRPRDAKRGGILEAKMVPNRT